jgi:hypothetical protein
MIGGQDGGTSTSDSIRTNKTSITTTTNITVTTSVTTSIDISISTIERVLGGSSQRCARDRWTGCSEVGADPWPSMRQKVKNKQPKQALACGPHIHSADWSSVLAEGTC